MGGKTDYPTPKRPYSKQAPAQETFLPQEKKDLEK